MSTSSGITSTDRMSFSYLPSSLSKKDESKEEESKHADVITKTVKSSIEEYVIAINVLCDCYLQNIEERKLLYKTIKELDKTDFWWMPNFSINNTELTELWKFDKSMSLDYPTDNTTQNSSIQLGELKYEVIPCGPVPDDYEEITNIGLNLLDVRKINFERLKNPEFNEFIAFQCKSDPSLFVEESKDLSMKKELDPSFIKNKFFIEFMQLATDEGIGARFAFYQYRKDKKIALTNEFFNELKFPSAIIFSVIFPYIKNCEKTI